MEKNPPNTDTERKSIDTIVIHHTSNPPGMSKDRLSGIELMRLYAPYFYVPKSEADKRIKGKPIYSGHARGGKQVFWPYHWLIRKDGEAVRLLGDGEIGWHAGNWDVNCRSVAICFDGDYENAWPSDAVFASVATIIEKHYPRVAKENILGHREVNPETTCPSNLFLPSRDRQGWKKDLLDTIRSVGEVRRRVSAVIWKDNKVLLLRRVRPGHDYFVFPGGGVEEGETLEEALKREVKEELTLDVVRFRSLFTADRIRMPLYSTSHTGEQREFYFLIEEYEGIPEIGGPEKERISEENQYHIVWMPLRELKTTRNILPQGNAKKLAEFLEDQ